MTRWLTIAICSLLVLGVAACGNDDNGGGGGGGGGGDLKGTIAIDGSSTVQPFAQAALELFQEENPDVRITVGGAGTGDGFEKFCRGELDIADASREIEEEETAACKKTKVSYSQVQVANDGIAVVSNKGLPVKCMKTAQLKELYAPKSKIKNYSELGSGVPNKPVSLFSPGSESGTFDFFTETVLETDAEQREANVQTSPDDNVLVTGVSGEENALGYFGYSFYEQNKDKLNLVSVDGGGGCVAPSTKSIQDGSYKPLSRPLYMYPSAKALKKPEVKAFMDFVIKNQDQISKAAKIVPMTSQQAQSAQQDLTKAEG
jgi:phosphate transport system substrate-binding protein